MKALSSPHIRGIVFDLDGTLYFCETFAGSIQDAASGFIADLKGIGQPEAALLIAATRLRLSEKSGIVQTLSEVCRELGGSIRELHGFFAANLRPETHLVRDARVILLLKQLSEHYPLYIYTNNNHALTTRIVDLLGLDGLFRRNFVIDDNWRPKPDEEMLLRVLSEIALSPAEALFVGDRYDVDLRLPEQLGCPVYLSRNVEQLLRLEELLTP
ncbi:MAG: HAD family hydrolase [Desulfuromonadales bacterium]